MSVGAAGALLCLVAQFLIPRPARQSVLQTEPFPTGGPGLIGALFRFEHFVSNYYVQLAIFLFFFSFAILRRDEKGGWRFALFAGLAFPEIVVFHWLR